MEKPSVPLATKPVLSQPPGPNADARPAEITTTTVDECIAHLRLLALLADLRDSVTAADGLFGLHDASVAALSGSTAGNGGSGGKGDGNGHTKDGGNDGTTGSTGDSPHVRALALLREKRWAVYVVRSVARFGRWFATCVTPDGGSVDTRLPEGRMTVADVELGRRISDAHLRSTAADGGGGGGGGGGSSSSFPVNRLPPLDVLMVWHAFVLNPRDYLEDCLRLGRFDFWQRGFPLRKVVDECVTPSLDYLPPPDAVRHFEAATGFRWNNVNVDDDPDRATVDCPQCGSGISVQWTAGGPPGDLDAPWAGLDKNGLGDRNFFVACNVCHLIINHERLCVGKFRRDFEALMRRDIAMPGTILGLDGRLPGYQGNHQSYANHFLKRGIAVTLNDALDMQRYPHQEVKDIRAHLEQGLRNANALAAAGGSFRVTPGIARVRRASIRRMMSHYWDNSSPFALDLVGAVLRQGTFVQKMDDIDWLHSFYLPDTMRSLISKYHVFLNIIRLHAGKMAVPTLDVDLAWHTHQLASARYYIYTTNLTQIFINHDDKVESGRLSDSFEWTSKQYTKLTGGQPYSRCVCWYCEAVRQPHTYATSLGLLLPHSTIRRARQEADSLHSDPQLTNPTSGSRTGPASDPDSDSTAGGPPPLIHISAHNAVPLRENASAAGGTDAGNSSVGAHARRLHALRQQRLLHQYQKALRRQRKRGSLSPVAHRTGRTDKDDPYSSHTGLFPYAAAGAGIPLLGLGLLPILPTYPPYGPDPGITSCAAAGMYPGNPACGTLDAGAPGNCVAGACANPTAGDGGWAQVGGIANCSTVGGCGSTGGLFSGGGGCGGGGGGCGGGCGGACGGGGGGGGGGCGGC